MKRRCPFRGDVFNQRCYWADSNWDGEASAAALVEVISGAVRCIGVDGAFASWAPESWRPEDGIAMDV